MSQDWQYAIEEFTGVAGMQEALCRLAAEGWEFVDVIRTTKAGLQMVLKRPAPGLHSIKNTQENMAERRDS